MNLANENKGDCKLMIHLKAENGSFQRIRASKIRVSPVHEFIYKLREIFGQKNVWIN